MKQRHVTTVYELLMGTGVMCGIPDQKTLAELSGIPEATMKRRKKTDNWDPEEIRACSRAIEANGGEIDSERLGNAILRKAGK